ncbi:hypothetical protein [Streptomyces sp. NPDC127098]|uniref:hypothetical protein n=1 Tax=Streptomyces sp. NPDC127098 TaxID=3347137 RepID=UPI00365A60CD
MTDPTPPRTLDIPELADQLDTLADRYMGLWNRINERPFLNPATGLADLAAYLEQCHALVKGTLRRLTELAARRPSQPIEAGIALTALTQAVENSTHAAGLLATATGQSALTTVSWADHEPGAREQLPQAARAEVDQRRAEAMARLEQSALALHSTAAHARSAEPQPHTATPAAQGRAHAEAEPRDVPRLTAAQRSALQAIADGRVRLHETLRGSRYLDAGSGARITLTTYNALQRKGLISRDTSTMLLFHGQLLAITKRGQAALAATRAQAPARPPGIAQPSSVRRRSPRAPGA